MKRRRFLKGVALALAGASAGCVGSSNSPEIAHKTIEVLNERCGMKRNTANVHFYKKGMKMVIKGAFIKRGTGENLKYNIYTTNNERHVSKIYATIRLTENTRDRSHERCNSAVVYKTVTTFENRLPTSVDVNYQYPSGNTEPITVARRTTPTNEP